MATKTMRSVRKVEKPRPLKTSDSFVKLQPVSNVISNEIILQTPEKSLLTGDNILENLKCLHISISNGNITEGTFTLIGHVCGQLKEAGSYLELTAKDQLDKYFVTLRNASRDERIAIHVRMRLLEIIELRAMGWKSNDNISSYYEHRIVHAEDHSPTILMSGVGVPNPLMSSVSTSAIPSTMYAPPVTATPLMTSASQVSLGPGEILKNSGRFIKPTKIPGKNFFKDEIVIRNSDSGKVSPGARDRLVQITGPHEENISKAKLLIEDTIRRNASPVRDTPELGNMMTGGSCTSLNSTASEESLPNQPSSLPYQSQKYYMQQVPNVMPHSPVALQSCQPSQVVTQPQQAARKIPLMHSLSTGNNALNEYSYTVTVGPNVIRVSGSEAEVVKTAKLVLEEYFSGLEELSQNQSSPDVHSVFNPQRKYSRLQKQDSENGNGSLSNGHVGNSSSEEDTLRADGSPPTQVSDLPLDYTYTQASPGVPTYPLNVHPANYKWEPNEQVENSTNLKRNSVTLVRQPLFPASKPEDFKKAESSGDLAKKRRDMFGRSSSQKDSSSQERSLDRQLSEESPRTSTNPPLNSYDFLLDCATSNECKVLPQQLKEVVPEVASIIVQEEPLEYFDPVAYKALASTRKSYPNSQRGSTSGPEEAFRRL